VGQVPELFHGDHGERLRDHGSNIAPSTLPL